MTSHGAHLAEEPGGRRTGLIVLLAAWGAMLVIAFIWLNARATSEQCGDGPATGPEPVLDCR